MLVPEMLNDMQIIIDRARQGDIGDAMVIADMLHHNSNDKRYRELEKSLHYLNLKYEKLFTGE